MIHFELIFVKSIRCASRFILGGKYQGLHPLHVAVQLFQQHLLKRLSLFHCVIFAPLSKISQLYLRRCISGFPILSH